MSERTPPATARQSPQAVVFDIGGVLLDWNPRYLYRKLLSDEAAVERFLASVCTPDWNLAQDAGRPWLEAVEELAVRFPAERPLIEAFHRRWPETVRDAHWDTVALLEALKARRVPVHAITNFSAETFALARQRFPFLGGFDGLVVSGEVGLVKPDRRIFELFLARHGLAAEACLFVDDSAANVAAAAALGMTAHHFTAAPALEAELRASGLL